MWKLLITIFLLPLYVLSNAQNPEPKPKVIVMTDGEIDDHSSMIRFLLYTCDIELLAIIETNSIFQRDGHSDEDWYENQIKAYGEIYPNLIKHNPDYPTMEYLKSVSFIGDEEHDHLRGLRDKRWELIPGAKITYEPSKWADTPGSDRIVEILLQDNEEPVHIQAWGGGNTAARAFYKLKTEHPKDYERAASKAIMYNIWYQDGAGNYIEQKHPEVTMIYCGSFAGTWNYRSQPDTHDFIDKHVKNNHGPLGELYPQDYISEGDSPAFFYSIQNGLLNYVHPTYGGWGGRFEKTDEFDHVYKDAVDDGDKKKSLRIWIDDVNNDYQARMDWNVKEYKDANHPPIVKIKKSANVKAKPGEMIRLSAAGTEDPDGDQITFRWWHYDAASTCKGAIELDGSTSTETSFTVPNSAKKGETIHVFCEVKDDGTPSLKGYERIIIEVQ